MGPHPDRTIAAAAIERCTMRENVLILRALWLGLSLSMVPMTDGRSRASGGETQDSTEKPSARKTSLRMSPGVVCRSIDGYEEYEPLPGAAQTSEEKLLVYLRPLGFKTEMVDGAFQAHLVPDFQIRKRGQKAVLREKKKMFEYKPTAPAPPQLIYLKSQISLKGLPPGEYDLTIILHDEVAEGSTATQIVKFKVIPPIDLQKTDEKTTQPDTDPQGTEKARQPDADPQKTRKARERDDRSRPIPKSQAASLAEFRPSLDRPGFRGSRLRPGRMPGIQFLVEGEP
jgi:hypothetical protein